MEARVILPVALSSCMAVILLGFVVALMHYVPEAFDKPAVLIALAVTSLAGMLGGAISVQAYHALQPAVAAPEVTAQTNS